MRRNTIYVCSCRTVDLSLIFLRVVLRTIENATRGRCLPPVSGFLFVLTVHGNYLNFPLQDILVEGW